MTRKYVRRDQDNLQRLFIDWHRLVLWKRLVFDLILISEGESFLIQPFFLNCPDAIDRTALFFHRPHSFGQGKGFHSSLHLFDRHLTGIGRLFWSLLHIDHRLLAQFPQNHGSITVVQIAPFRCLEQRRRCRLIRYTGVGGVEEMVDLLAFIRGKIAFENDGWKAG